MSKRGSYFIACVISLMLPGLAQKVFAEGVASYLPLNLESAMQRQVERVLVLAGKTVLRKPYSAEMVKDALPAACAIDESLCGSVGDYLQGYFSEVSMHGAGVEVSAGDGDADKVLPNQHGRIVGQDWQVWTGGHYRPSEYLQINGGFVARENQVTPTGTVLSVGYDVAQLDVGFRDHWFSPLADSSMLVSTEAPTMPSITISNSRPISSIGFGYEMFVAEMSKSELITFQDHQTTGKPRLAGSHLEIQPVDGYALGVSRTFQFGGGQRNGGGIKDFYNAFFKPTVYDQTGRLGEKQEFGNQQASITASMAFPGKWPFAIHFEYAGEDTSYTSYLLGRTALSMGLDFPLLWRKVDFSAEFTEWQNAWYAHHLYGDGYRNDGFSVGHWFGDNRNASDAVGGQGFSVKAGLGMDEGSYWRMTYRHMRNEEYGSGKYDSLNEVGLSVDSIWRRRGYGLELYFGRDVYGERVSSLTARVGLANSISRSTVTGDSGDSADDRSFFVDLGAAHHDTVGILRSDQPYEHYSAEVQPTLALGVSRRLGERTDLGVRVEYDKVQGRTLLSFRALDYRYRFRNKLAGAGFLGVSRYDVNLPMFGYYCGVGLQRLEVLPSLDFGVDWRYTIKAARQKLLPDDPDPGHNPDFFYDNHSVRLYLSYRL